MSENKNNEPRTFIIIYPSKEKGYWVAERKTWVEIRALVEERELSESEYILVEGTILKNFR